MCLELARILDFIGDVGTAAVVIERNMLLFPDEWKLFLLSSHTEFERTFGKQADKKRKLYNGMLKCDLFMYGLK